MFQCPYCVQTFKWNSRLERHVQTHTREKPFECQVCDKAFGRRYQLAAHVKTHDANPVQAFHCHLCDLSVDDADFMKKHLESHGLKGNHDDKEAADLAPIRKHPIQMDSNITPMKTGKESHMTIFLCDECDSGFTCPNALKDHMGGIHHDRKES